MPQPDRALRRQVARLQELEESDRVAILERLDAAERSAVLALIANGTVTPPPQRPPVEGDDLVLPAGLSPWLKSRLEAPAEFGMSEHTLAALRACVVELVPQPAPPGRSLIGVLRRRFGWDAETAR